MSYGRIAWFATGDRSGVRESVQAAWAETDAGE
jgi:hypothetical protein